jgi:hypothetical protein
MLTEKTLEKLRILAESAKYDVSARRAAQCVVASRAPNLGCTSSIKMKKNVFSFCIVFGLY